MRFSLTALARILHSEPKNAKKPMFARLLHRRAKTAFNSVPKLTGSQKPVLDRINIGVFACMNRTTMKYPG